MLNNDGMAGKKTQKKEPIEVARLMWQLRIQASTQQDLTYAAVEAICPNNPGPWLGAACDAGGADFAGGAAAVDE